VIASSPKARHSKGRVTGLSDMTLKTEVPCRSPVTGNGDSRQIDEKLFMGLYWMLFVSYMYRKTIKINENCFICVTLGEITYMNLVVIIIGSKR
jgi:hypothetical protein